LGDILNSLLLGLELKIALVSMLFQIMRRSSEEGIGIVCVVEIGSVAG